MTTSDTEITFRDQLREAIASARDAIDAGDDYADIPVADLRTLLRAAEAHATWMGVRS